MGWLRSLIGAWATRRNPLPEHAWLDALGQCRYAGSLPRPDRQRLRDLTLQFLRAKRFEGAQGLELTSSMAAVIALRACVPILNLGLDYYSNWYGIVVYPGDFRVHHETVGEDGVVHRGWSSLCGESLEQGPVVLSWNTLATDKDYPGYDLVIHECAHKLDMLNGAANGYPPLPANQPPAAWSRALTAAFETMNEQIDRGVDTTLDPYAATDPAEYFAVASEAFFTVPWRLRDDSPDVYNALSGFYRQDPASLMSGA